VPAWGNKYVAYGYSIGITAGINTEHTLFAPDRQVTFQEFTAFLLRVLGYAEERGEFKYENAVGFAEGKGLFSPYSITEISAYDFIRGNAVLEMVDALETKPKESELPLIYELSKKGVLNRAYADWFHAKMKDV
jgi:hypothetical protein